MEGTIGEIRLFAGTFAPQSWALCYGQILAIASNTALFSILGTTYGGNGTTTFALPDLRGRTAVGTGQGPGLSNISLGEVSGTESVTLLSSNMPAHTHTLLGSTALANTPTPSGATLAASPTDALLYSTGGPNATLSAQSVGVAGNGFPLGIRNPYLGLNYIICLYGFFPSRN